MFQVYNEENKTMPLILWTYCTHFSCVFNIDSEHVFVFDSQISYICRDTVRIFHIWKITNLVSLIDRSSVVRQKGESQNGCFKKTKHVKFSEKRTFLTPWYAHVTGGKKYSFFWKLTCFVFLKHPFWDTPFCLITDELVYWNYWYTDILEYFVANKYF